MPQVVTSVLEGLLEGPAFCLTPCSCQLRAHHPKTVPHLSSLRLKASSLTPGPSVEEMGDESSCTPSPWNCSIIAT